jgi:hypothetical protein
MNAGLCSQPGAQQRRGLRSYFHLRNLRATISSSDVLDKPRARLAAALKADHEQALGKSSRLVYHLVSLDGGGRLIEHVQNAREQVDDLLIKKLAEAFEQPNSECVRSQISLAGSSGVMSDRPPHNCVLACAQLQTEDTLSAASTFVAYLRCGEPASSWSGGA